MKRKPLDVAATLHVCQNLRDFSGREMAAAVSKDPMTVASRIIEQAGPDSWSFGLDKPIYIGGVREETPTIWSMWGIATKDFPTIATPLTKWIKRDMIQSLRAIGVRTLYACGLDGFPEVARWLSLLGAVQDSSLKNHGKNGEDFILYRWDLA